MMDDTLVLGIVWYGVFVISVVFHEAAHAFTAYRFGDRTAFLGGQVSLNPLPHIQREPLGMVVIPWISYAMYGWMMGWASAPYDPQWADARPRQAAWMALSGPGANLLLVVVSAIVIQGGLAAGVFSPPDSIVFTRVVDGASGPMKGAAVLVSIFFSLNLVLFVFNMIPIAPLDGRAWLELLLKGDSLFKYRMIMMHPSLRMFGIFIAWMIMSVIYGPIFTLALNGLYLFHGVRYG